MQNPTVSVQSITPSIQPFEDITLNWTVSDIETVPFTATVTGALTGNVYYKTTAVTTSGTTPQLTWTGLNSFPIGPNIAGGEPVIQAISVHVLPGMEPVTQSRVIPYTGPCNLKATVVGGGIFGSTVGTEATYEDLLGDTVAPGARNDTANTTQDALGSAPLSPDKVLTISVQVLGTIENGTTLEVVQTGEFVPWWGRNEGVRETWISVPRCIFALSPGPGPQAYNFTLTFEGTLAQLFSLRQDVLFKVTQGSSGISWLGLVEYTGAKAFAVTDPPSLDVLD